MCEPTTLAALSVASTVASVYAQQQAADQQEQYNQRQYENTMRSYAANINQTNLEHMQEREAASQKIESNNLNAAASKAKATVGAGEAGIGGISVGALLDDLSMKQSRYNGSVITNYQNAEMALDNQRQNIHANASSTINGLKTPQAPNYLAAGLQIGTTAYRYQNGLDPITGLKTS